MQLNVKSKIKILAIEEEIARLELQLFKEDSEYLGATSAEKADIVDFEKNVLKPALKQLEKYTHIVYEYASITPDTITGTCKPEPEPEPEPEPFAIYEHVAHNAKAIKDALISSKKPVPEAGWTFTYLQLTIYVILLHDKRGLNVCVRKIQDLEISTYSSLDWFYLWSTRSSLAQKSAFFANPIQQLARMITEAPSGIPNIQSSTTQTGRVPSGFVPSIPAQKASTKPALPATTLPQMPTLPANLPSQVTKRR